MDAFSSAMPAQLRHMGCVDLSTSLPSSLASYALPLFSNAYYHLSPGTVSCLSSMSSLKPWDIQFPCACNHMMNSSNIMPRNNNIKPGLAFLTPAFTRPTLPLSPYKLF